SAGLVAARVSALRHLTRRHCLSIVSAANVASSAPGHETEHRRGVGTQCRPPQHEPLPAARRPRARLCRANDGEPPCTAPGRYTCIDMMSEYACTSLLRTASVA